MNSYCKAIDLAKYVTSRYFEKYRQNISGLKLQKSLYFLFAYWGGFIKKGENKTTELTVKHKYLFDDEIQAWTYGPVVPNVFHSKDEIIGNSNGLDNVLLDIEIKSFVDNLCDEIFEISDFKLVEIAHQDNCWKNHYDENEEFHNNQIPKEEIIEEYACKI